MTMNDLIDRYKTQVWLSNKELEDMFTFKYWNDREVEKSKEWYVLDGDFTKMERYLQESCLQSDLLACIRLAEQSRRPLRGVGVDLAAGVLWPVPQILANSSISKIYCVEMSQHRLFEIGPQVLAYYDVPVEKVELCLGSFYNINLPDSSVDFVLLIQAFHHAEDPDRLLQEIYRVLKSNGVALIVGEHRVSKGKRMLTQLVKFMVAYGLSARLQYRIFGKSYPRQSVSKYWQQLRPPHHPILGDHYYFLSDYYEMFTRNGFEWKTEPTRKRHQNFAIWPKFHGS